MKKFSSVFVKVIFSIGILTLFVVISRHTSSQDLKSDGDDKKDVQEKSLVTEYEMVPMKDLSFGRKTKQSPVYRPELAGTNQAPESEPNDTFGTADVLTGIAGRTTGSLHTGTPLTPANDADWYSITVTAANSKFYAGVMTSGSGGPSDSLVALVASDGTTVIESDDDDGSFSSAGSTIAGLTIVTPGTYYIRVTNFSTTTAIVAPYDLYFAIVDPAVNVLTAETEPNNNGTPQVIPASQHVSGVINPAGDSDTFSFSATAGDTIYLGLDLDPERDNVQWNGRIGIGLLGTPPNFLVTSDASAGTVTNPLSEAMFMTVKATGTFQVYVDSQAGLGAATQTYNFNVTIIPAPSTGTCTTYTNAVSTPIPDAALTSSTISIPDSKIIRSLKVVTDITHPNFPDLDVHLRSPSNNDNGIFTDAGISTQTGAQNYRFDNDVAAVPLLFTAGKDSIWRAEPAYNLNWFNGENSLGTWSLDIRDDSSTVTTAGTLNSWSLEVCEEAAPTGNLIYNEDFEASDGGYTHSGTQDEWERGLPATVAQTVTAPFIAAFNTCTSGTNCWKTDLDNTYNNSANFDLLSPTLNLTQYPGTIRLYWSQRYQMESITFDRIWVRVTNINNVADTRMVWHSTNASMSEAVGAGASLGNTPESAGWGVYSADISDFAGKAIQVTFHVETDASAAYGGWAIDDVQLRHIGAVAATVPVGGRVMDAGGRPVSRASVTLTPSGTGETRTAITNSFGYYRFDDVEVGQNYTLQVNSKRYSFEPRVIFVIEQMEDVDFTASP